MHLGGFEQVAAILVVCVASAVVAMLLRQPVLVGLLIAGAVLGPGVLGLVEITEPIELLAEIGIALLLFTVGLKLDVRIVSRLGPVALAVGLAQVALTAALGVVVLLPLGVDRTEAVWLGLALAFSSTVVVVKLLGDRRELDTLHGRLALGILVVQDVVVVIAMVVLTGAAAGGGAPVGELVGIALRGVVLIAVAVLVSRLLAAPALHLLGRQAELLVLGSIAWAVTMGSVSVLLGFSPEVGAFLAGMVLAATPYREAVSGRLNPLRDFLLLFFFIEVGARVDPGLLGSAVGPVVALSLAALIGKPLIVAALLGLAGYRRKVSIATGLTLAQVSEFSLILIALGVSLGVLSDPTSALVTVVALVTIAVSTQLIERTPWLVDRLGPVAGWLERRAPRAAVDDEEEPTPEVVVVGLGRFGTTVVEELLERGTRVLGVDFDPRTVVADRLGIPVVYGDGDDPTLAQHLPLTVARWVVSTVRSHDVNMTLVTALRRGGYTGGIAVASEDPDDCAALTRAGADVTIRPLHVAAGPLLERIGAADRRRGLAP